MKSEALKWVTAMALVAALSAPARLAAQEKKEEKEQPRRYKLIELGTFGGPNGYFTFVSRTLNQHGVATGFADALTALNPPFCLVDCFVTHTFQWKDGVVTDLGALPGIGASFPNDINAKGVVAGMSLNGGSHPDPAIPVPFFDAVIFKDGHVIDLGTFGGPLSYSGAINDDDQVVGFALNATPDSFDLGDFCQNFPMPNQMRAFIWHDGVKKDLGTLGGTDSCALFINDRGQVAGNSFTNTTVNPGTGLPTLHPFLWDGDEMQDLGTLGGTIAVANGINNHGQVAGVSRLADDQTQHAFLWEKGKLTDLGSLGGIRVEVIGFNELGEAVGQADLPGSQTHAFLSKNGEMVDLGSQDGDPCSVAISINSMEQIVGGSSDCINFSLHAFLWENGRMTDLNVFVPSSSTLTLTEATFINDRGEITVEGVLPNGDQRAVLLIPCDEDPNVEGCDYGPVDTTTVAQMHAP